MIGCWQKCGSATLTIKYIRSVNNDECKMFVFPTQIIFRFEGTCKMFDSQLIRSCSLKQRQICLPASVVNKTIFSQNFSRGNQTHLFPLGQSLSANHMLYVGDAVASWLVRSSPDRAVRVRVLAGGHCVVFLGKTLNSHSASLHPGV